MNQNIDSVLTQIKNSQDYFEKARLILLLKREKGIRIIEISKKLAIKPAYISHIIRLNRLPDFVKDGYYSKLISISHLFIISRLKTDKQIMEVYEKVLADNFTTQQTEELIREMLYQIKDRGEYLSSTEKENFTKSYEKKDNIKVRIVQSRLKGKIIIEVKGNLEKTSGELKKIIGLLQKD